MLRLKDPATFSFTLFCTRTHVSRSFEGRLPCSTEAAARPNSVKDNGACTPTLCASTVLLVLARSLKEKAVDSTFFASH